MSNTRSTAADRAAKKAAASETALEPVADVPEELSPELQMALDLEQKSLEIATMQAQLTHLTGRVSQLVKEVHELKNPTKKEN